MSLAKIALTFVYDVAVVLAALMGVVLLTHVAREWNFPGPMTATVALIALSAVGIGLKRGISALR